jgi:hypothetical protein
MHRSLIAVALSLLSLPLLGASADLQVTLDPPAKVRAGLSNALGYTMTNNGPDDAPNVIITLAVAGKAAGDTQCGNGCKTNPLKSGQSISFYLQVDAPLSGSVTATVSATSSTPDPNPANNSATATMPVSAEPDLYPSIDYIDQALKPSHPFSLGLTVINRSISTAHGVTLTIDLPAGARAASTPSNCTASGNSVLCTLGDVDQVYAEVKLDIVAPPRLDGGTVTFTATVHSADSDFDETNNTFSRTAVMYRTTLVTTTADGGPGSLRQAIGDVNAACITAAPCLIGFQIEEASATPWKTITVTSPLPAVTATNVLIDGSWQTEMVGDTNPDGPEVEISGGGSVVGHGLTLAAGKSCTGGIDGLAIGGFRGNGILLTGTSGAVSCDFFNFRSRYDVHDVFVGTDPTGTSAHPNGLRGITLDDNFFGYSSIRSSVLSGNDRSGIFDIRGAVTIAHNRVGVKAHADEPLPNGASGIYIASEVTTADHNVVAFNRDFGISVHAPLQYVAFNENLVWANQNLAIDNGLDGVATPVVTDGGRVGQPVLTRAQYDPATDTTIVEGTAELQNGSLAVWGNVEIYSSDTPGTRFMGDAQRLAATTTMGTPYTLTPTLPTTFTATLKGDHTGEWLTALVTHIRYETFDSLGVISGELKERTSELSLPVQASR